MLFLSPPPLPPSTYRSLISTMLDTCTHVYFWGLHMFPKQKSLMFDGVLFKILWITMPYLFEVNRRAKSHHLCLTDYITVITYFTVLTDCTLLICRAGMTGCIIFLLRVPTAWLLITVEGFHFMLLHILVMNSKLTSLYVCLSWSYSKAAAA